MNYHYMKKITGLKNLNISNQKEGIGYFMCSYCDKGKFVEDDGVWHCRPCNYSICTECLI